MSNYGSQNRASIIIGLSLVGLGTLFLIGQLFEVDLWRFFWPFFIITPGLMFFVGMVLGGREAGPLAIPGSIVTTVGLLLLYQSIFNHFESWAYAWALIFPTSVGIGLMINGAWSRSERLIRVGSRWASVGLTIFLIGGVVFELLLDISDNLISDLVWPGLLILFGLYLLIRRARPEKQASPAPPASGEAPPAESKTEFEPLNIPPGEKKE